MPLSPLAAAILRSSLLTRATALEAERRARVYGGALDTVLLEMGAVDEPTLVAHLADVTGLPAASREHIEAPDLAAAELIDSTTALRLGAVPIGRSEEALEVAVHADADHDALVSWSAQRSLLVEPHLVAEVRFRALLTLVYGIPLPARFVALLGKIMGASQARQWLERATGTRPSRSPLPAPDKPADEVATLVRTAQLGDDNARRVALRTLSRHLDDPRATLYARSLQGKLSGPADIAEAALAALAQLGIPSSVPAIIETLRSDVPQLRSAAHAALVAITLEDLGDKPRRWLEWWERMGSRSRAEWLLEALASRKPELRMAAAQELHELSGEYFGYHYDLPERDREEARRRWLEWWKTVGRGRFGRRLG